jgi:hypothetical protein
VTDPPAANRGAPEGCRDARTAGRMVAMIGPILVVIALLVVIPVGVIMSGGVLAGVIAHFLRVDVDTTHEGSELINLNG